MADPRPPADGAIGTDPTLSSETPASGSDDTAVSPSGSSTEPPLAARASPREELIGQSLGGRYTVLELIGTGGMSIVYLARHELLKKPVAVKVLREELATNKASLSRFHREALAAASIGDPHIVDVTDYGFTDRGDAYIVMERLEGKDLRRTIAAEGAFPAGRAVAIARQILRALQAAHALGIIHRDLKAENVFLTQRDGKDFVKLLDFGISKITQPLDDGNVAATGTGVVMGTPQYIAPEQAHGAQDLDHRVDLYAMGVILYEMLTGTLPFTGKSALEVVMKHVQEEPQPPRARRPELAIPAELEAVVLKAMAKSPADRHASAEAMLEALPEATALPGGFTSGSLQPAPRPSSGGWRWPLVGVLLLAAAGTSGYLLWSRSRVPPVVDAPPAPSIPALPGPTPRPDLPVPDLSVPDRGRAAAEVTLTVEVVPAQAEILLADRVLGRGRIVTRVPRSQQPLALTLRARGFQTRTLQIVPAKDEALRVQLRPANKPAGPSELAPNPYRKR
jgi:serine/threonine-protein kinase